MKSCLKVRIYLALAAMLVTLVVAGPAAAKDQVPFKGSLQGVETNELQFPTLFVDGSGTGIASHIGRFSVTWDIDVNLPDSSATGSMQLTAANGDSIFTELVGQGEPSETPGFNRIVEINTITGGTGRFAGATGSFTVERLLEMATGVTSGSFEGTISSRRAAH